MAADGGATGAETVFELQTVCGERTKAYANAKVESRGARPSGATVEALSTTGLKKVFKGRVNQDCVAVRWDSGGRCVGLVVDGHGENGHECAARICATLPGLVAAALDAADVPRALTDAFLAAETDLERHALGEGGFNLARSGGAAAAVALLPDEGVAYLASCGDSQALVVDVVAGTFTASRQHKPHDTAEQQRIVAAGGSIKIGKPRCRKAVLSRAYGPNGFGIAMSRSFGDLCMKNLGVIVEPSVVKTPLPQNACAVLGSDGLFEFVSPAEVPSLLDRSAAQGGAACVEALVNEAHRRWLQEEAGLYCDDISCLLLSPTPLKSLAELGVAPPGPSLLLECLDPDVWKPPVGMY